LHGQRAICARYDNNNSDGPRHDYGYRRRNHIADHRQLHRELINQKGPDIRKGVRPVTKKTIGKLAGINLLFDLDYKSQQISIELSYLPLRKGLRSVTMHSRTSWRPVSTKAILVGSQDRRRDFEDNVITTFCLRNVIDTSASSLPPAFHI
jgi:hypothetical protein